MNQQQSHYFGHAETHRFSVKNFTRLEWLLLGKIVEGCCAYDLHAGS